MSTNPETFFLISTDQDDPTMNNAEFWDRFMAEFCDTNSVCVNTASKNKVDAINRDIETFIDKGEVILIAQDDMIPQMQGYDDIILNDMAKTYPDTNGILWYNDSDQQRVCTLVVMGKKYWEDNGRVVYHGSYESLWCDNEMTEKAKRNRKITYIPTRIIKHEHYAWGGEVKKDALYERNDRAWVKDKRNYDHRKRLGFPV